MRALRIVCKRTGMPGAGQPWLWRGPEVTLAYYAGIIDYLQEWTGGKQAAMMIKRPGILRAFNLYVNLSHAWFLCQWRRSRNRPFHRYHMLRGFWSFVKRSGCLRPRHTLMLHRSKHQRKRKHFTRRRN